MITFRIKFYFHKYFNVNVDRIEHNEISGYNFNSKNPQRSKLECFEQPDRHSSKSTIYMTHRNHTPRPSIENKRPDSPHLNVNLIISLHRTKASPCFLSRSLLPATRRPIVTHPHASARFVFSRSIPLSLSHTLRPRQHFNPLGRARARVCVRGYEF